MQAAIDLVMAWRKRLSDPGLPSFDKFDRISKILELVLGVTKVEATDPETVVITTETATPLLLAAYVPILPKHIWEKLDWSDPTKNPEIMAPSVSSGPFKLKEWKKDNFATFVANDSYYRGRPNFDEIVPNVSASDPTSPDASRVIRVVNTGLKPWSADNFDVSLEAYEMKGAVASVSVFRKDISDFFGEPKSPIVEA